MRWLPLLLVAVPAVGRAAHSGTAGVRTGPELSDLALFAVAALAVWLVRRALRRRYRKD